MDPRALKSVKRRPWTTLSFLSRDFETFKQWNAKENGPPMKRIWSILENSDQDLFERKKEMRVLGAANQLGVIMWTCECFLSLNDAYTIVKSRKEHSSRTWTNISLFESLKIRRSTFPTSIELANINRSGRREQTLKNPFVHFWLKWFVQSPFPARWHFSNGLESISEKLMLHPQT